MQNVFYAYIVLSVIAIALVLKDIIKKDKE